MTAAQLLASCSDRGVRLWREGDGLGVEWPETLPTATAARLLETLKRAKPALLPLLEAPGEKTDQPTDDSPTVAATDEAIEAIEWTPDQRALLAAWRDLQSGMLPAEVAAWFRWAIERRDRFKALHGARWFETSEGQELAADLMAFADWYASLAL